jgi:hypothetical protein
MADHQTGLSNLVNNYEFQENAQKFGFAKLVFLEAIRIFTTEKSTAFWIIISQITLGKTLIFRVQRALRWQS